MLANSPHANGGENWIIGQALAKRGRGGRGGTNNGFTEDFTRIHGFSEFFFSFLFFLFFSLFSELNIEINGKRINGKICLISRFNGKNKAISRIPEMIYLPDSRKKFN